MPMPEIEMRRLIRRRLAGKEGSERIAVLRQALSELPGFHQGPYGQLRKWLKEELARTRVREQTRHRDTFAVPKEGHSQVAVVGPPNAGKSSLLVALSGRRLPVGDYAFTTVRPVAATFDLFGARVQLVEVPGLVAGAAAGRGQGRALAAAARTADVLICPLAADADPAQGWAGFRCELAALNLVPDLVVLTRCDLVAEPPVVAAARTVAVSSLTGAGLPELRRALWELSGLVRVFPRGGTGAPLILSAGATVADCARLVHQEVRSRLRYARVWGPSARFAGQRVGPGHVLADGDELELVAR